MRELIVNDTVRATGILQVGVFGRLEYYRLLCVMFYIEKSYLRRNERWNLNFQKNPAPLKAGFSIF